MRGRLGFKMMECKYCNEPVKVSSDCTGRPKCSTCTALRASCIEIDVLGDEMIVRCLNKLKMLGKAKQYDNRPAVKERRQRLEELKSGRSE